MSKSREAIDREKNQAASQQNKGTATPSTDQETRYRGGRESFSDFPKQSTSLRNRNESDWRSSENRQLSNRYERESSYGRSQFEQPSRYENRGFRGEDTGDFYSRSIRERDEYDRGRYNRDEDWDRSYRGASNSRGYQPGSRQTPPYYGSERYEREEPYRGESRFNREDYRSNRESYNNPAPINERYYSDVDQFGSTTWRSRGQQGYDYVMRCRDIMTRDVTTCTPEANLREVAEKMEDENVGSIPVVENGRLIGIVTDRDIVCRALAQGLDTHTTTARSAMTEEIMTCHPDESIVEAIHKMGEYQVRRIPVCDPNGNLRGMISIGDVALEAERDIEVARALEQISQPNRNWANRR